jgi:transcriptional regulator with XRE-family HTH domain
MHELIARGAAAVRRRNGWTQEQAARAYRNHGLAAWRTSTVGSLESGLRKPRLDEVILMCAALDVTLANLIRAADEDGAEQIELGDGAMLSTTVVLGWLYEGFDAIGELPHLDPRTAMRFPVDDKIDVMLQRATAEHDRISPLLKPIIEWAVQHEIRLNAGILNTAYQAPSDAERHAARRLGVEPAQVRLAARALWQKDFDQERDARVDDVANLEPRSRQARRGLVTREMLAEMERMLKEASGLPPNDDLWHGKKSDWWWQGTAVEEES